MSDTPFAICLLGPTACGKTELSLRLCEHLPCEIISVDSALVYRGMDIGTAKPSISVRRKIPHHLIDILEPTERYSAGLFVNHATQLIRDLCQQGKIPLLTGGTMFYFNVLEHGLDSIPVASDKIRDEIEQLCHEYGLDSLYNSLQEVDAKAASRIHAHDAQRIKRALEVHQTSTQALSEFQSGKNSGENIRLLKIGLTMKNRSILHERVEKRFDKMLDKRFIQEVSKLILRGDLNANMTSMRAVGYAQVWSYLTGKYGFDEMRQRSIYATRQLIKRQLTWMRKMKEIQNYYVDLENLSEIQYKIEKNINKFLV